MQVALALVAHPDDAEILCGGVLIRLAQSGWRVHIATMTPGDCGTMDHNRWQISAIRTDEAKKAAAMIGATYHCLDERDGLVTYNPATIQKAIDLCRRVTPSLIFTHAPKDYMMDHEQTSMVARAASFVHGAPNISAFPLLAGTGIPHLYYCDPLGLADPLGNPVTPTTVIDVTEVMEKKLEMLACHASQRAWLQAHHGMDEYLDAVRRNCAARGKIIKTEYAEGFIQHRGHAYPGNDILEKLFSRKGK